jgi:hypothetical protein
VRGSKRIVGVVFTAIALGCTTLYDARIPLDAGVQRDSILHCLTSLHFSDNSTEFPFPEMIAEDPELFAVWATPTGS